MRANIRGHIMTKKVQELYLMAALKFSIRTRTNSKKCLEHNMLQEHKKSFKKKKNQKTSDLGGSFQALCAALHDGVRTCGCLGGWSFRNWKPLQVHGFWQRQKYTMQTSTFIRTHWRWKRHNKYISKCIFVRWHSEVGCGDASDGGGCVNFRPL